MSKHIVCRVDELPPGARRVVEINGRSIGVFNLGGEFFALLNRCPHQGGPLCAGRASGLLVARAPGDYTYTRRGEILRCPWHGWEFDIRTGQSWFDPARTRVRTYPVAVETLPVTPGAAETDAAAAAPDPSAPDPDAPLPCTPDPHAPPAPGFVPGPYVAERYPVTVEAQMVVVELP